MLKSLVVALVLASTAASAESFIASPGDYSTPAAYAAAYAQASQSLGSAHMVGACYSTPTSGYNVGKCQDVLTAMERKVLADQPSNGGRNASVTGG